MVVSTTTNDKFHDPYLETESWRRSSLLEQILMERLQPAVMDHSWKRITVKVSILMGETNTSGPTSITIRGITGIIVNPIIPSLEK